MFRPKPDLVPWSLAVAAILAVSFCPSVESAKILMIPMIGASHTINFAQIGGALTAKGHTLHAYVNGDCRTTGRLSKVGVQLITYNNTLGGCMMESEEATAGILNELEGTSGFKLLQVYQMIMSRIPLFNREIDAMLSDQNAIRKMKKLDFDLVIVDGLSFNKHVYVIAHILDKPIVSVASWFSMLEAGVPALPSLFPYVISGLDAKMSFVQRLQNLAALISAEFIMPLTLPMYNSKRVSTYAPDRPYKSISTIASETKLWLSMTDNVIDYPKVRVPSIIDIGGLNTKPAEQLTGDLAVLADKATEGLIIVSFGSQFVLPPRLLKVFIDAFRGLPQTVIMRHGGEKPSDLPPNVHVQSWMPQNDLLGHPNTRLFVTHAGANGQFEALYHSVPMLSLPLLGDQNYNAARAAYHGISLVLNIRMLTVEELRGGVKNILNDPTFKQKIQRLSAMFRDRPLTPMETAVYYIEHVIKHGGDDLYAESANLPFYQFWCLDILAFLTVLFFVCSYVFCKFCGCLCRSCCRRKVVIKAKPKSKTQ